MTTHIAYLLLGSNMNNRLLMLEQATKHITAKGGAIVKASAVYETAAWGNTQQQPFLNEAIELKTTQTPEELLHTLIQIEKDMGRKREEKWGPRLIDIDILFYDKVALQTANLTIPHPYLHHRRFTLVPLAEIAGDYIHPVLNKTVNALLQACEDTLQVNSIN